MMTPPIPPDHEHRWSILQGSELMYVRCYGCHTEHRIPMEAAIDLLMNGPAYKEAATQGARYITDFISMDAYGRMAAFDRLCDAVAVLPEDVRYQP